MDQKTKHRSGYWAFGEGIRCIKSNLRTWLYISLGLMATPLIVLEVVLAKLSTVLAKDIRGLPESGVSIEALGLVGMDFVGSYLSAGFVAAAIWGVGYFTVIKMTIPAVVSRGGLLGKAHLLDSFKLLITYGFTSSVVALILLMFTVWLSFHFFLYWLFGLLLMIPCIAVHERCGAFRSIKSSLFVDYVSGSGYSTWWVLVHLLSLGAISLIGIIGSNYIGSLPLLISRSLEELPQFVYASVVFETSLPVLLSLVMTSILFSLTVSYMAIVYSFFYTDITNKNASIMSSV